MTSFPFPFPAPGSKANTNADTNPTVVLLQPSKSEYQRLKRLITSDPSLSDPAMLLSHYHRQVTSQRTPSSDLILQTSSLLSQKQDLNLSTVLASMAYIHIVSSPPEIPGPEYAAPADGQRFTEAKGEARRVWGFVYERFREDRMRICGLDLERWDGSG